MPAANENLLDSTYSQAAKGLWPHRFSVGATQRLYRFVDLNRCSISAAADGPWWFEYEYFQNIKQFSIRHGYTLGYAARLFAAVLYEWSEVNAVITATVKVPLVAWKGRGKQVQATGKDARDVNPTPHGLVTEKTPVIASRMTPMQGPLEVLQLYIPGLGRPHNHYSKYFGAPSHEMIATG